jgi:hypothetical protein
MGPGLTLRRRIGRAVGLVVEKLDKKSVLKNVSKSILDNKDVITKRLGMMTLKLDELGPSGYESRRTLLCISHQPLIGPARGWQYGSMAFL